MQELMQKTLSQSAIMLNPFNWLRDRLLNLLPSPIEFVIEFITGFLQESIRTVAESIFTILFWGLDNAVATLSVHPNQMPAFGNVIGMMQTAIMPIAGGVLAFVITVDLVQILIERNNSADFDVSGLFKWLIKAVVMIIIVTNTQVIVNGLFNIGVQAVTDAGSVGGGQLADISEAQNLLNAITTEGNTDAGIGELLFILVALGFMWVLVVILQAVLFVVTVGRFIEILLVMSVAPIPLATLGNSNFSSMGFNYLKVLFAYAMIGFFFLVAFAIFFALLDTGLNNLADSAGFGGNLEWVSAVLGMIGNTALLILALFKIPSLAKSIFGAV